MKSSTVIALVALFASSDQSFGVNALSIKQKEASLNLIDAETDKAPKKKAASKKGKKSKKSSKKKEESEEDKKKKQDEKE